MDLASVTRSKRAYLEGRVLIRSVRGAQPEHLANARRRQQFDILVLVANNRLLPEGLHKGLYCVLYGGGGHWAELSEEARALLCEH